MTFSAVCEKDKDRAAQDTQVFVQEVSSTTLDNPNIRALGSSEVNVSVSAPSSAEEKTAGESEINLDCWTDGQKYKFLSDYPWLRITTNAKLICATCFEVKDLGN